MYWTSTLQMCALIWIFRFSFLLANYVAKLLRDISTLLYSRFKVSLIPLIDDDPVLLLILAPVVLFKAAICNQQVPFAILNI